MSNTSIPAYDLDAFLIEAELLLDWYLPRLGVTVDGRRARDIPQRSGARRCSRAIDEPPTWVLRDYHSPNLLWLPERHEHAARLGFSTSRTP